MLKSKYTTYGYEDLARRIIHEPKCNFIDYPIDGKSLPQFLDDGIKLLSELLSESKPRAETVLISMYGLQGKPHRKLYEIGDDLGGLEGTSIENIHDRAIKVLKRVLGEQLEKYVGGSQ